MCKCRKSPCQTKLATTLWLSEQIQPPLLFLPNVTPKGAQCCACSEEWGLIPIGNFLWLCAARAGHLPCQGTVASMGLWCTSQNRRRQGLSPVTSLTCQHLNCENGCQAWELQWVQLPPFSSNMLLHMGHWPTREGMLQQVLTAQVMFHTEKNGT